MYGKYNQLIWALLCEDLNLDSKKKLFECDNLPCPGLSETSKFCNFCSMLYCVVVGKEQKKFFFFFFITSSRER